MGGELWRFRKVRLEAVVTGEVAAIECEEEIAQPGMWGGGEAVKHRVQ